MWWTTDRREQRHPVRFEDASLAPNMAHRKSFKPPSVQAQSVQAHAVQAQSVQAHAVQAQSVQAHAVQAQSVQAQSVQPQSVQPQSVQPQSVQPQSVQPKPADPTPKHRRLSLSISVAQAAANLILQESGADCHAEIPRLRKDIRALEAVLREQATERSRAARELLSVRDQARAEVDRFGNLQTQLAVTKVNCEHALLRSCEQRKWLILAADISSTSAKQKRAENLESQQQVADLLEMLAAARSENRSLVDQLETRERENRIFSDVIDDMESRHERELKQQRQQREERETRHRSLGDPDRAEVQQLNIRIVCQAAEIRSLEKQVADLQPDSGCDASDYTTVLDDQNHDHTGQDDEQAFQLNARLENSLHAVRIELDSAVHELKYANAETLRLKEHAACVERKYESELQSMVQLAELHAIYAATFENVLHVTGERESVVRKPITPESAELDELVAKNERLSRELEQREADFSSPALRVQQLEIEVLELQEADQELQALRESQVNVTGENETLSAINLDLSQSRDAIQAQLADSTERHSQEKSEWKSLLVHHEQSTQVAQAECGLLNSRIEEQQATYQRKLTQQLEVIECLKTDLAGYRTRQAALQSDLEGEQLHRTIADREIQRLENEAARLMDVQATEREDWKQNSKQARDEHGGESPVRSVA